MGEEWQAELLAREGEGGHDNDEQQVHAVLKPF